MRNMIFAMIVLASTHAVAGVPYCNIAQLNSDGMPTSNSAVKEFISTESLTLRTPDKSAKLTAFWNDSFGIYQMSLSANGVEVNSVIEKPSKSGLLNLWIRKTKGFTAQCRFEID